METYKYPNRHNTGISINCSSRLSERSAPPFRNAARTRMNRTQRLNEREELFHLLVPARALSPKWLHPLTAFVSKASHNEILAASCVNPLIPVRAG